MQIEITKEHEGYIVKTAAGQAYRIIRVFEDSTRMYPVVGVLESLIVGFYDQIKTACEIGRYDDFYTYLMYELDATMGEEVSSWTNYGVYHMDGDHPESNLEVIIGIKPTSQEEVIIEF